MIDPASAGFEAYILQSCREIAGIPFFSEAQAYRGIVLHVTDNDGAPIEFTPCIRDGDSIVSLDVDDVLSDEKVQVFRERAFTVSAELEYGLLHELLRHFGDRTT